MSESPLSEAPSIVSELNGDAATPATTISFNSKRKRISATLSEPLQKHVKRARKSGNPVYKEEVESEEEVVPDTLKATPKKGETIKRKSKSTTVVKAEIESKDEPGIIPEESPKKAAKKPTTTTTSTTKNIAKKTEIAAKKEEDGVVKKKVVRKRKTKEEKEAEAMPIAARTVGSKIVIGAHISSAGGRFQSFHSWSPRLSRIYLKEFTMPF
jgi:hypothetical protein